MLLIVLLLSGNCVLVVVDLDHFVVGRRRGNGGRDGGWGVVGWMMMMMV